ncbi:hypothetical protein N7476_011587 [Penicillium atrosanguineum]|uniref:Uncharacterized protein n=1 Tax=Penicillium atrosanguineum TaxID=1132637 RepID=A0A9W9PMV3_9EURO|nr:hypothetical protein N7476_011587 [Penicillium atrosanguineum]
MTIKGVGGEVPPEAIPSAVLIVSRVHKCSLRADADAVTSLLGSLEVGCGSPSPSAATAAHVLGGFGVRLSGFDECGLAVDDVFEAVDELPHLSGGVPAFPSAGV